MPAHIENPVEVRFVGTSEAAVRLGVCAPTVRRWVREGRIIGVQPGGREGVVRIPMSELERLAEGRDAR